MVQFPYLLRCALLPTWAYLSTTPSPRLRCVPAVQFSPSCCWDSTIRSNLLTMSLSKAPAADILVGIWTLGRRFLALLDRPCRMPTPEHCVTAHTISSPTAQRTIVSVAETVPTTRLRQPMHRAHRTRRSVCITDKLCTWTGALDQN